ncbi:MAG: S41 family peptidase [Myxococcota bacterium]
MCISVVIATMLVCAGSTPAHAAPPRVLASSPSVGAAHVDPDLAEIVVTYDQPMATGYSVVGAGPHSPRVVGECYWRDATTFVMPVRLSPDWDYEGAFNYPPFEKFRNVGGEAAAPYPLRFSTAADPRARPRTAANRRSFAALRDIVLSRYSYRDRLPVDWEARFASFEAALLTSPSARSFAREAAALLGAAEDGHLVLKLRGVHYATTPPTPPPNMAEAVIREAVPGWSEHGAGGVVTGRFADGVGYVLVREWNDAARAALATFYRAVAATDPGRGLIVDVRPNVGGDETLALAVAGCFVATPVVYARASVLQRGKWLGPFDRALAPIAACPTFPADRVVVLQGPAAASSNEGFLMMMRAAGATLVGERSRGSSGRPSGHGLGRRLRVMAPTWIDTWPDGTALEGVGITPDVTVLTPPAASDDPVLASALALLRSR